MGVNVLSTKTKVNMKYAGDANKDLSAYSVDVEVKNGATDQNYYDFATALIPLIDAENRNCTDIRVTVTETIE